MKNKKEVTKKHLSVLFALLLLVCSIPMGGYLLLPDTLAADALISGNFTYALNSTQNAATIVKCDSSATGIVNVPGTVDNIAVKSIAEYAFIDATGITEITLPASVTNIDANAFANPNVQTINIATSLADINPLSFSACPKLANINVNKYNRFIKSENGIVYNNNLTTLLVYPMGKSDTVYTLPSTCTSIEKAAISDNAYLENITFPDGFVKLSSLAIQNCSALMNLSLPDSFNNFYIATTQGAPVRNCTALTAYEVSADNACFKTVDGVLYNKAGTKLIKYPGGKSGTTFVIPSTVTEIGFEAFENADNLVTINIPDTVTKNNIGMFMGCDRLEYVNMGNGSTTLYENTFDSCVALKSFTVPDSVISIKSACFNNCLALETVTLGAKLVKFPSNSPYSAEAFTNTPALKTFTVSEENTYYTAIDGVLYNKDITVLVKVPQAYAAASLVIPSTVTALGSYSLNNTLLSEIIIPESVVSLGDYALAENDYLTELTIPASVESIGAYAISGCDALDKLSIKGELTYLSDTFAKNTFVNEFEFTDSDKYIAVDGMLIEVTDIAVSVIQCISQANLINCQIPNGVTVIRTGAFADCNDIMTLTIPETVTAIQTMAFSNNIALMQIYAPATITNVAPDAFGTWQYRLDVTTEEYAGLLAAKAEKLMQYKELKARYATAVSEGYDTLTVEGMLADAQQELKISETNIHNVITRRTDHVSYPLLTVQAVSGSAAAVSAYNSGAAIEEPDARSCTHENTMTVPAVAVSCTSDGYSAAVYCKDCYSKLSGGDYTGAATGHSFGEWTSTATCTSAGIKTRTCSVCEISEEVPDAVLGHNFSASFTVDVSPTCVLSGTKSRYCSRCDVSTDVTVIPATGVHTYGEWEEILPDTGTSDGVERRTCSVCSEYEDRPIPMGTNDRTDNWQVHSQYSCTQSGVRRMYFGPTGSDYIEEIIPATGHSFNEWAYVSDSTCSVQGTERRTCANCGETENRYLPLTAHVDSDYNCVCDGCGAYVNSVKPHGANCFCYKNPGNGFIEVICKIISSILNIFG